MSWQVPFSRITSLLKLSTCSSRQRPAIFPIKFFGTHQAARFVLPEQRKLPGSERSVLVARGSASWSTRPLSWDTLARTGARRHSTIPTRIGETHSSSAARIRGIKMRHDFTWIPFRMSVMEGDVVAGPAEFYMRRCSIAWRSRIDAMM
jgi:hypothetical protein